MKIFSATLKGTTTVSQGTTNLSGSFTGSYSGSVAGIAGDISDYSSSVALRTTALEAASGSFSTRTTSLEASSGSFSTRTTSLEASSGSFSTRTTAIERVYATTGSNTFTAAQIIQGTLTAQTLVVQTVTSSVLFSTGSNKIGSSLSNVQELTGSVGITGSLAVVTTGTEFQVNAGGVNIGNALTDNHIISGSVTINPNGLFVSSSGNVGIGTTSPSVTLDVKFNSSSTDITGSGGSSLRLLNSQALNTNNFHTGIWFRLDNGISNKNGYIKLLNNIADSAGDFAFILTQSGTEYERVRIKGNGNVGIGNTSPGLNLSVQGLYGLPATSGAQGTGIFRVQDSSSNISLDMGVIQYFGSWIQSINKSNSSALTLALNPNGGNVGIGTSSPSSSINSSVSKVLSISNTSQYASLVIQGRNGGEAGITIADDLYIDIAGNSTATNNNIIFRTTNTNSSYSTTERMRITSGGNVGIGDSGAATVRFQIKSGGSTSGSYAIITRDSANADLLVIRDDGYGYLKAAAWAYGSDSRIKENINYIQEGLNKVLALKPATFDYIDGVKNNIGWIAQDVQEVIPQAVGVLSETNNQLTLKSDFIVPYLVKAVQQQQVQIEELKTLLKA